MEIGARLEQGQLVHQAIVPLQSVPALRVLLQVGENLRGGELVDLFGPIVGKLFFLGLVFYLPSSGYASRVQLHCFLCFILIICNFAEDYVKS